VLTCGYGWQAKNFSEIMAKPRAVRLIEVAEILGVTHQRASKIVAERGFPKPSGRQGQSRQWDRREVLAWAKV
jgi:predicted DNA-binding transcriptional regulator AlpA